MGKALNTIIAAGAAAGTFVATGGNVAAAQAAFALTSAALAIANPYRPATKPQTTEGAQKQPIPPRVFAYGRSRLFPYYTLFETNAQGQAVDVYAYADGEADGVEQAYLNDDKVQVVNGIVQTLADKKYQGGNVKAGWTLGAAVNTAFAAVISALPGIWTGNHRGDGVVTGYLIKNPEKDKYFQETYPQGDNVSMSLVARWQKCFDPRTGQTVWTENAVLQLMHYYLVRRGYDYARKFQPTLQYWINAANICDEQVMLKAGGSEPRYRSCVTYQATSQPKEIVASLLETFDGWVAPRGDGALIVYAGKLYQPTVTIGPDDILSYRIDNNLEDENAVDQLRVSYVSAEHDYNTVETDPWGGENGASRTDSFGPQTPSFSQNRRLAKRLFARTNAPKRGNVTTNLGGRKARGQRYVYLDLREEGFDPFDGATPVVEITSLQRDFQEAGVSFDWLLTDPNVDSWNPATEEGEPAALGNRIAAQPLTAPTIASVTKEYGQNTAFNTPGVKLTLSVNGPNRADLTWFVRTRAVGSVSWLTQSYPDVDPGAAVTLQTDFLPLGEIEVEVAYQVGDGRVSPFGGFGDPVNTGNVLPQALTGLSVNTNADGTLIAADWETSLYASRYLVEVIVDG